MSGYALLAHAWGAEVRGWDRVSTPYLGNLPADVHVEISAEPPAPPAGWEPFVSTAFAGHASGRPRANQTRPRSSVSETGRPFRLSASPS